LQITNEQSNILEQIANIGNLIQNNITQNTLALLSGIRAYLKAAFADQIDALSQAVSDCFTPN